MLKKDEGTVEVYLFAMLKNLFTVLKKEEQL